MVVFCEKLEINIERTHPTWVKSLEIFCRFILSTRDMKRTLKKSHGKKYF